MGSKEDAENISFYEVRFKWKLKALIWDD